MSRLTRLTAILTQLQAKRVIKAREIADRFGVSLRTVYRDIKTLQEAGVPIGAQEGVGYFLVVGYRLPPVSFTEEEANAVVLVDQWVQQQGDQSLRRDYQSAIFKVKAVLGTTQKEKIAVLEQRITPSVPRENQASSYWLADLQKAITARLVIELTYVAASEQLTQRRVEPLALSFTEQAWYLLAFCQLREDIREFRLDRIQQLKTTEMIFAPHEDFVLKDYYHAR